jgi:hypothetical protein
LVKTSPEEAVLKDAKYVNRSRYGVQIRPYLERFKPENVKLLIFEEYVKNQVATLNEVAHFLNIDPHLFADADTEAKHQSTGQAFLKYTAVRQLAETEIFQSMRTIIPEAIRYPIKRRLSNKIDEKPVFSEALKQLLWQFLEDDVHTVEQILGRSITVWKEGEIQ